MTTNEQNQTTTLYAELVFSVGHDADEHIKTEDAARDELTAWLQSLGAEVHMVAVRRQDENTEVGR